MTDKKFERKDIPESRIIRLTTREYRKAVRTGEIKELEKKFDRFVLTD